MPLKDLVEKGKEKLATYQEKEKKRKEAMEVAADVERMLLLGEDFDTSILVADLMERERKKGSKNGENGGERKG